MDDESGAPPECLDAQIAAAAALLARARDELARGGAPDLRALTPLLEGIATRLATLPGPASRPLRLRLSDLLDGARALAAALGDEREGVVGELRSTGTRRRAGTACRGARRV